MISKLFRLRRWRVQKVLKKGNSRQIGLFLVKFIPNKKKYNRFGLVLSRKFEKLAAVRNKKKRQIFESIRFSLEKAKEQDTYLDIVIIPSKEILTCNYEKILQNSNDIVTKLLNLNT